MAFTTVRYGSRFPTLSRSSAPGGSLENPYMTPKPRPESLGGLLAGSGVGGSPTSFTQAGGFTPTQPSTSVTPAGDSKRPATAVPLAPGTFTPPDAGDLSSDPILAQIQAAGQRSVDDARQGALNKAEDALIGYGSANIPQTLKDLFAGDPANPIYAALNDANVAAAASGNPDSMLAQLALAHQRNNAGIDQATNAQNLFYSSTHANELGDEANAYRQNQNAAAQSLAQLLEGANQGVLDAQQHASDQYLAELPNAYQRALDLATLLGGTGADTTGADTSGGTAPTGFSYSSPTDTKKKQQLPGYYGSGGGRPTLNL